MAKAKPVVKAAALDKKILSATDALTSACDDANKAVVKRAAEGKKLLAEVRRHLRKKRALTKRAATANNKLKKESNAENRKALAAVTKELKVADTALAKARANKKAILEELALLKAAAKRLNAYTKAIATADKALNKPVKKKRARKKST
jgi:hypothetical protein